MLVKKAFELLPATEVNIFVSQDLSPYFISAQDIDIIFSQLNIFAKRIKVQNHLVNGMREYFMNPNNFVLINKAPNFSLYAYHHLKLNNTVINFSSVNYRDVLNVHHSLLLPMFVYGYMFSFFVKKVMKREKFAFENDDFYTHVVNYFVSLLLRLCGKKYGILSISGLSNFPLFKLLCCTYVFSSFYGQTELEVYNKASEYSQFYDKSILARLPEYDFKLFEDFLRALNDFNVFPGINGQQFLLFVKRYMKNILNVIIFEDAARFFASLLTYFVVGKQLFDINFELYNAKAFENIIYYILSSVSSKDLK